MKNKILIVVYSLLFGVSVYGFTDYIQNPNPNFLLQERANEKQVFDHDQALYNGRVNQKIRTVNLIDRERMADLQEKKKTEEMQDKAKRQILFKF